MTHGQYVNRVADIPNTEHWVIITETSVYIPGDERSKSNPGHGYPASSENYLMYRIFLDEASFIEEMKRELAYNQTSMSHRPVKGLHVSPYVAKTNIEIELSRK